jgi:hypothetical protein
VNALELWREGGIPENPGAWLTIGSLYHIQTPPDTRLPSSAAGAMMNRRR